MPVRVCVRIDGRSIPDIWTGTGGVRIIGFPSSQRGREKKILFAPFPPHTHTLMDGDAFCGLRTVLT